MYQWLVHDRFNKRPDPTTAHDIMHDVEKEVLVKWKKLYDADEKRLEVFHGYAYEMDLALKLPCSELQGCPTT